MVLYLIMIGIYWNGKFIPFYGLLITLGIVIGTILGYFLIKHRRLDFDVALILVAYGLCGGMIGAKFLYLFIMKNQIYWNKIFDWNYLNVLLQSGYVFYGGLIGGILALLAASKIHKIEIWKYMEACIPCIPMAHGFGRIGCYIAGCCYGIPYEGVGHIVYHMPSLAPVGIPLFPVQLLEANINFLLAILLFVWIWKKETKFSGICIYLLLYAVVRFILESFFRNDIGRGKFLIFTTSQWISIFIIGIVLVFICYQLLVKNLHNKNRCKYFET